MIKQFRVYIAAFVLGVAATTANAADHPAQRIVEEAISSMLAVYSEDAERLKAEPEYLQAKVDELIVPHLDFPTMTRLAVSKFWRRADEEQQQQLVDEFKKLLLGTYTNALTLYSGESIEFEPFRPESREDRAEVRSNFGQSGGSDIPVIYRLRDKGGWSIYDIEVAGVSLVTSSRTAFSKEIEKGGIEGLIKTLKERNGSS